MAYTIGLDYGTNSVRCVIVDVADGKRMLSVITPPPGPTLVNRGIGSNRLLAIRM